MAWRRGYVLLFLAVMTICLNELFGNSAAYTFARIPNVVPARAMFCGFKGGGVPVQISRNQARTNIPTDILAIDGLVAQKEKKEELTDLWVIKGKVYDLGPWLKEHPGGRAILSQSKGCDATALFESYHAAYESKMGISLPPVSNRLKPFYVRDATPAEQDLSSAHNWKNTPAYDQMKEEAQAYFLKNGYKAPWQAKLWYAFWTGLYFTLAIRWVTHGKLWEALLLGVAMLYGPADVGHSGTHYEIFQSARLNHWFANLVAMWMFVPSGWTRQHVMMHHTRPTYIGDIDIHHFAFFGFWRLSKDAPWRWHHKLWWLKIPVVVMATGLAVFFVDASTLFVNIPYLTDYVRHKPFADKWEYAKTLVQFLLPLSLFCTVGYLHGPLIVAAPWIVFGMLFYLWSQMAHEVKDSQVDRTNTTDEWVMQQARAARGDFSPHSMFWTYAAVGLNNQSVHHVFPSCHWHHYPALNEIVLRATGETNRPRRNLWTAIKEHFMYIKELNEKP